MITLVHTGLQVPHTRIRVTGPEPGEGAAWAARLCEDTTLLGTITNHGHGAPTRFYPRSADARHSVETFVADCRRDGQRLAEDAVLDALAREYDYAALIVKAERNRAHLVRGFDEHDTPVAFELRPTAGVARDDALARAAASQLPIPAHIVRAELWAGGRWEEFYRRG